jgi:uncharacterized OB-fold protein
VVRKGQGSYADAGPFVVAAVELDEGPRMLTNVVDIDLKDVHIGQRVRVVFHRAGDQAALPRFTAIGMQTSNH